MKIIDEQLINSVVEEAKKSPRLRKNYNFHGSLQDKCHRFLNALEPGTFLKEARLSPSNADWFKIRHLIDFSEGSTKNKSHLRVTFKWSRGDKVLLPALSGVVKTFVLTVQR